MPTARELAPLSDSISACDNAAELRAQCCRRARGRSIDQRSLSFRAIPGTDKRRRLCVAFLRPFYRRSLSGLYPGAEFPLYGGVLRNTAMSAPTLPAFISSAPTLATTLATEYLTAPAAVPTDRELAMLRGWICQEFQRIPYCVNFQNSDIDLPEAVSLHAESGVLWVSTANIAHPFLTDRENALFRAVHDAHHIAIGADSTLNGEMATYVHACGTAPSEIWWMLRSEILLQAAACIVTGHFQPQKLVR